MTTAYDPLFAKYAGRLPVAFLRALSYKESSQNPSAQTGSARGILQVIPTVREGYNQRYGTSYTAEDLFNAEICTKIAAELINRIALAYDKHTDPNMKVNFGNPEFVKLLLAGWNSGYSEAAGVGSVARYLEQHGVSVTHDNVFRYAGAAGATQHLQNPDKQRWQKSVADLYFKQPDSGRGFAIGFGVILFFGLGAWALWRLMDRA